jgi:hypothetical protein
VHRAAPSVADDLLRDSNSQASQDFFGGGRRGAAAARDPGARQTDANHATRRAAGSGPEAQGRLGTASVQGRSSSGAAGLHANGSGRGTVGGRTQIGREGGGGSDGRNGRYPAKPRAEAPPTASTADVPGRHAGGIAGEAAPSISGNGNTSGRASGAGVNVKVNGVRYDHTSRATLEPRSARDSAPVNGAVYPVNGSAYHVNGAPRLLDGTAQPHSHVHGYVAGRQGADDVRGSSAGDVGGPGTGSSDKLPEWPGDSSAEIRGVRSDAARRGHRLDFEMAAAVSSDEDASSDEDGSSDTSRSLSKSDAPRGDQR